ncbi:ttll6 [Symbiodinium sp. KB8]|nr:ttll6 [Symbiodinium sp. KB8]
MTGVTVCHRRAAKLLLYSNLLDIDGRNAQSMTNEMCIVTLPGGASSDLFRMQQARQPFAYAGSAGIPPSLIGFAVVVVRALQKGCWGWPIFGLLARLSEVVLYSGQARPIDSQCAGPGAAAPLLQLREELSQRVAERKVATEALARRILASLARLEPKDQFPTQSPGCDVEAGDHDVIPCVSSVFLSSRLSISDSFQKAMTRAWALALLAFRAHGDLQAMQLSADGEMWSYPMEAARRLMRHQKGARAYLQEVDGQPSDTAEKVVTISTNETHNVDAFTKELKAEAATASSGTGLALFGTLLCAMILFYLVNQPHKDLQISTWQLLSGNIALFCTVILFMALKKLWKCIVGSLQDYQDPSERLEWGSELATAGYFLSFLKFAALMFFFPMLKSKLQDTTRLAAARTCGTYLIGYAGSDSFAYILSLEPFSSGAGYCFLGLLLMLVVLSGLLCLAFRLADRMQPSDGYDPDREEEQIEAAGFQIAFLLSVWIRFLVTGFLPGSKKGARALVLGDLSYLGTFLLLSVVIFGVAMFKIRPLAGQTDRRPAMRRFFRILTETSAMTMGWLLMFWVQWAWWYSLQGADGSHNAGRHSALMCQAVTSAIMVYCGMVVLFFLAKRAGKNASDFKELTNAWVLQTGFCWEVAIYEGLIDAHSATYSTPLARRMAAIACILLILIAILPAWYWYIIPRAMEKADGKSGDAAGSKAEGADAEKPDGKKDAGAEEAPSKLKEASKEEPTPSPPAETAEEPKPKPEDEDF